MSVSHFFSLRRAAFLSIALGLALPSLRPAAAQAIAFSKYPGPVNILGTADDVTPNLVFNTVGGTTSAYFTTEYSRLAGGVGFVVDSATGGNPNSGYTSNIGGIVLRQGENILVCARPDAATPASPSPVGFSPLRFRFVNSADGTSAAAVTSVSFDFVSGIAPGATDTAQFYDINNNLLNTLSVVDGSFGSPNQRVSYTNASGIARVDIGTSFSVALDNVAFSGRVGAVPEPGSVALLAGLTTGGAGLLLGRKRRQRA